MKKRGRSVLSFFAIFFGYALRFLRNAATISTTTMAASATKPMPIPPLLFGKLILYNFPHLCYYEEKEQNSFSRNGKQKKEAMWNELVCTGH